jgi:(1->4)-alpha-D-glucan 1-alpha-D-glucosylmutase
MLNSVREASANTRWVIGDHDYEAALAALVARALDPAPDNAFLASFRAFEAAIAPDGEANALVQTALKLTAPGVPDIYQGAELWDQSLVDPDNRRPVDFAARAAALRAGPPRKLALIKAVLDLRRALPALFDHGSYEPLAATGPAAASLCAFARRHDGAILLVATALHPAVPSAVWDRTKLAPPSDIALPLRHLVTGAAVAELTPAVLFRDEPVALLVGG